MTCKNCYWLSEDGICYLFALKVKLDQKKCDNFEEK
jgi:hypothetical protein